MGYYRPHTMGVLGAPPPPPGVPGCGRTHGVVVTSPPCCPGLFSITCFITPRVFNHATLCRVLTLTSLSGVL